MKFFCRLLIAISLVFFLFNVTHKVSIFASNKVLITKSGQILPLYPVSDPRSSVKNVSFFKEGKIIRTLDSDEELIWEKNIGDITPLDYSVYAGFFGGFDFDGDGWPDLGLVDAKPTDETCGVFVLNTTSLFFVSGKDGKIIKVTEPLRDLCWDFGSTIYPTPQWTHLSVLFGNYTKTFGLVPLYATKGWIKTFNFTNSQEGNFASDYFYYPSAPEYDNYPVSKGYIAKRHIANGLILKNNNEFRLVFFTSGRVVQYKIGSYGPSQLISDLRFMSGGRSDLVGRNYGLVTTDPNDPQNLVLIAGTSAYSVFSDKINGKIENDHWGQIERHVTIYDWMSEKLDDRFFSFAHDNNDGNKYQNRVVYPNSFFLKTGGGQPSRAAYTVYVDGHWVLHISKSGSTADELIIENKFLWDINDLNDDGIDEMVVSPANGYFPEWTTSLLKWQETDRSLKTIITYQGVIPYLTPFFREEQKTSAPLGLLYPVVVDQKTNKIVMQSEKEGIKLVDLPIQSTFKTGDLDKNGKVDIFDYNILVGNFGKTTN
ncbi:hypothetical protein HY030_02790 [Candidatus Gottesmanbacteria bacterium]|nr:hypothetical protein [Candidatus Gottesmanbacteria bacterium]